MDHSTWFHYISSNVAIGNIPTALAGLHVRSNVLFETNGLALSNTNGLVTLLTSNANSLGFSNNTASSLIGFSSSNVGINQTSPTYTLDVNGTGRIANILDVGTDNPTNTTGSIGGMIRLAGTFGDGGYNHCVLATRLYDSTAERSELFIFKGNDLVTSGPDRIRLRGGRIVFDVYPATIDVNASTYTENIKAYIDETGTFASTSLYASNVVIGGSATGSAGVHIRSNILIDNTTTTFFNTTNGRLVMNVGTNSSLALSNTTGTAIIGVNSTSVGINTATPGFTLDVNGDLNFAGNLYKGGSLYISSQWSTNATSIFTTSNLVIGANTTALAGLHIRSNVLVESNMTLSNSQGVLQLLVAPTNTLALSNSTGFTRIGINSSNVGFNMANPAYSIDVTGNARITNYLLTSNIAIGVAAGSAGLHVRSNVLIENNLTLSNATGSTILQTSNNGGLALTSASGTANIAATSTNQLMSYNTIVPSQAQTQDLGATNLTWRTVFASNVTLSNNTSVLQIGTSNNSLTMSNMQGGVTLTISSSNLGINTPTPLAPLHVKGNTRIEGNMLVDQGISFKGLQITKGIGSLRNITNTSMLGFSNDVNGVIMSVQHSSSNFRFVSQNTGEIARLTGTGRLGLGTAAPQYTLDVNGSINTASNIFLNGNPMYNGGTVGSIDASDGSIITNTSNLHVLLTSSTTYNLLSCLGTANNGLIKTMLNTTGNSISMNVSNSNNTSILKSYVIPSQSSQKFLWYSPTWYVY